MYIHIYIQSRKDEQQGENYDRMILLSHATLHVPRENSLFNPRAIIILTFAVQFTYLYLKLFNAAVAAVGSGTGRSEITKQKRYALNFFKKRSWLLSTASILYSITLLIIIFTDWTRIRLSKPIKFFAAVSQKFGKHAMSIIPRPRFSMLHSIRYQRSRIPFSFVFSFHQVSV